MMGSAITSNPQESVLGHKIKDDREPILRATHLYRDPLLPAVPYVDGLHCEDHATFVAANTDEQAFRDYWGGRGLRALKPYVTSEFPANHIAFVESPGDTVACEDMIGLSVSDDPDSPVNRLVKMWGGYHVNEDGEVAVGRLQHIAYNVQPDKDMDQIRAELESKSVRFMTPVLTFTDSTGTGAHLKQMFVACVVPYGPFIEIVQRGLGDSGQLFQGFNADQIDVLYHHYNAYSEELIARERAAA